MSRVLTLNEEARVCTLIRRETNTQIVYIFLCASLKEMLLGNIIIAVLMAWTLLQVQSYNWQYSRRVFSHTSLLSPCKCKHYFINLKSEYIQGTWNRQNKQCSRETRVWWMHAQTDNTGTYRLQSMCLVNISPAKHHTIDHDCHQVRMCPVSFYYTSQGVEICDHHHGVISCGNDCVCHL